MDGCWLWLHWDEGRVAGSCGGKFFLLDLFHDDLDDAEAGKRIPFQTPTNGETLRGINIHFLPQLESQERGNEEKSFDSKSHAQGSFKIIPPGGGNRMRE